jgi:hypothetical protein
VRVCVHRGECSYVYEYLCLFCVSKIKKKERSTSAGVINKQENKMQSPSYHWLKNSVIS